MSARCIEIIAFSILPQCRDQFEGVKAKIASEARDLPGLITSTTQRSLTDEGLFVDTMVWESLDAARAGREAFMKLSTTEAFLAMMSGPPVFEGCFAWAAGDSTLQLATDR